MRKTKTRQLIRIQRLVENNVRKFLNEMSHPIATALKDSDELDPNDPLDKKRKRDEIERSWEELDRINRRFENDKEDEYEDSVCESKIHKIIKRHVKQALNEVGNTADGQKMLSMAAARALKRGDYKKSSDIQGYADVARMKVWDDSAKDKEANKKQRELQRAYYDTEDEYYRSH